MLRVVQVGLGGWGRDWLRAVLTPSEDVEVVACVDPVEEARRLVVDSGLADPARCHPTLESALESASPDAAVVTVDLAGHVPVAKAALDAGLHVLVEKPFAPTVEEAAELVQAGAARERVLMVSQNYRFFPAARAAASLVEGGSLGRLHGVEIDFRRLSRRPSERAMPHHRLAEPLLVDMSVHHFDLMRMVLGADPERVWCRSWNPPWSWFAGPAEAAAIVEFPDDLVVSYRGSWLSPGPATAWAGEWRLSFEGGEATWTSRDDPTRRLGSERLWIRPLGADEPRAASLPEIGPTGRLGALHAFAVAARDGTMPETSGEDNLGTLALTYAAVRSAGVREPVPVAAVRPASRS